MFSKYRKAWPTSTTALATPWRPRWPGSWWTSSIWPTCCRTSAAKTVPPGPMRRLPSTSLHSRPRCGTCRPWAACTWACCPVGRSSSDDRRRPARLAGRHGLCLRERRRGPGHVPLGLCQVGYWCLCHRAAHGAGLCSHCGGAASMDGGLPGTLHNSPTPPQGLCSHCGGAASMDGGLLDTLHSSRTLLKGLGTLSHNVTHAALNPQAKIVLTTPHCVAGQRLHAAGNAFHGIENGIF